MRDAEVIRCARHQLLGCALCGLGSGGVVSATPPREHRLRSVKAYDFGLGALQANLRDALGYEMTAAQRAEFLRDAVLARAERSMPEHDINSVHANLQADIDSKAQRGRLYSVRQGTAQCPKCAGRVDIANLCPVSGFDVRIPNFSKCPVCERDEARMQGCDFCDGRGWYISSWTQCTAYLACETCVARLRQPTKRGSATNFTTTSRAGEEYARKEAKAGAMCMPCQQRAARKAKPGEPLECGGCRKLRFHREALGARQRLDEVLAEIARRESAK